MIKRTLYFGNPAYLSLSKEQLVIKLPEIERNADLPDRFKQESVRTIPIEDIGVMLLDHSQITLTHALMARLMEENVALISCDSRHHPIGLFMPLESNVLQSERFSAQIGASEPLKKQLWQQTIRAKIENQATLLKRSRPSVNIVNMNHWAKEVTSGDVQNHEARAAAYYWGNLFERFPDFVRGRQEEYPNSLLNYGYTILRALVARALMGSGLLPTLGIHHHGRYNAYCLADDIMEPYRPYVDALVVEMTLNDSNSQGLTKEQKVNFLQLPVADVMIDEKRSPLQVAVSQTTASLAKCFLGESRKIVYPKM